MWPTNMNVIRVRIRFKLYRYLYKYFVLRTSTITCTLVGYVYKQSATMAELKRGVCVVNNEPVNDFLTVLVLCILYYVVSACSVLGNTGTRAG